MTSRLKRKLGEIGVDTSSRKVNENFCLIGTPLPPLEKSKDTGEFVPLWKQEVRDEKGRRRLHGAFTGGWSAGYFNSVGSKEGWTPSTFVSSRNDRAKKQASQPEDFMDEEDMQELKDSKKLVDATEEMDFLGGTQAEQRGGVDDELEKDPITRSLQAALLPAPKDSVGAQILKKMGWRLGQGIGPRISLKRRKEQDIIAYDPLTGNRLTSGSLDIPEDDQEASKHSYAPRDTPVLLVTRKDNTHGLGYVPGLRLNQSLGDGNMGGGSDPKLAGGFGLGALNDADEDDLDVYDNAQRQSSRRRVAYDNIEGDENDTVVLGGNTKKPSLPLPTSKSASLHFRDGLKVLAGFVISAEPVAVDKWFPLPEIPPGWKPNSKSVWAQEKENTLPTPPAATEATSHEKWKRSHFSADQRGNLLGETPLPSGPMSIFNYMSEKDKERIQRIASSLPTGKTSSRPDGYAKVPSNSPARVDPHIAQAALSGFQPFTTDPTKQARYTTYLQSQASIDGSSPPLRPLPGQKTDDFTKEVEDYAKAAFLFKPMSAAMAGRFTSAAVLEMDTNVVEGLHHPSKEELEASEGKRREEEEEREKADVDPKVNAAKMGMYGPLTREVKLWVPARLLCKRFGVKEPDVNVDVVNETVQQQNRPSFEQGASASSATPAHTETLAASQRLEGPRDITNIGFGEDETQGQDILTYERPSMDIFKAIFASDDEDEEEEVDPAEDAQVNDEGGDTEDKGFTKATITFDDTPVDPNTFKPTFIPRDGKAKQEGVKSKEKKDKRDKKKRGKEKSVLVSFEMEDGGVDGTVEHKQPRERPSKKRRKDNADKTINESADKPPLNVATGPVASTPAAEEPNVIHKGRKRAVDFMD